MTNLEGATHTGTGIRIPVAHLAMTLYRTLRETEATGHAVAITKNGRTTHWLVPVARDGDEEQWETWLEHVRKHSITNKPTTTESAGTNAHGRKG